MSMRRYLLVAFCGPLLCSIPLSASPIDPLDELLVRGSRFGSTISPLFGEKGSGTIPKLVLEFPDKKRPLVISDILTIDEIPFSFASDPDGSFLKSPGGTIVRAFATEDRSFSPVLIGVCSDDRAERPSCGGHSDRLTVRVVGGGAQGFPMTKLLNEGAEGSPLQILVPSLEFDFCENGVDPKTHLCLNGEISDWVLFDLFKIEFLSDSTEGGLTAVPGAVINPNFEILVGGVHPFTFRLVSDAEVPEPSTLSLMFVALVPAGLKRVRRYFGASLGRQC
jgi:hypothetical protein